MMSSKLVAAQTGDVMDVTALQLANEHQMAATAVAIEKYGAGRAWDCRRPRASGRGGYRSRLQTDNARWMKGNRLIKIHQNYEDLPEELRHNDLRIIAAREARRDRDAEMKQRKRVGKVEDFVDADDGDDETLFTDRAELSSQIEWFPSETYRNEREEFLPQKMRPVVPVINAYGALRMHNVAEMKQYSTEDTTFAREWYNTNVHELMVLFSFWMMLGIRMQSIKSYFFRYLLPNPLLSA